MTPDQDNDKELNANNHPDAVAAHRTELRFATFHVGGQLMGVDIHTVQEINRLVAATPVPHAPDVVRGVINVRGDVVTVLDLRAVLGLEPAAVTSDSRCVILESSGEKTGLLVDRIADVVSTHREDIEAPPANVTGVDARFFEGVVKLDRELLLVLDVRTVLDGHPPAEQNEADASTAALAASA